VNAVALSALQLRYEQRVFWRTPATIFFTVGLPVALLAIFTTINRDQHPTGMDGATFAEYFLPGMVTFAIASTCYGNVAVRMVYRREAGLLRRARTTPLPPASLIAGYIANAAIVTALVVLTLTVIGITLFDVPAPANSALVVVTTFLGALALSAIGVALSTVIPRVDAADPIILGTLLPAMFISGAFQPVASDSVLGRLSTVLPFRHLLQLDLAAFGTTNDHQPLIHVLVLAAWGAIGASIAVRRFTWQARR
jgi:ABC-2 type transport system permease protein